MDSKVKRKKKLSNFTFRGKKEYGLINRNKTLQNNSIINSLISRIDLSLVITMICLCIISVFMIYSATYLDQNTLIKGLWKKQLLFFLIGLLLLLISLSINYRHFVNLSLFFYIIVYSFFTA